MSPFQPGAEKAPEPKRPAGLAGSVGHTARQKPPDPKGKGLALALIAGVAVLAAIYQVATGSGAGQTVREQREREARAAEERSTDLVAPRDPNDVEPEVSRAPASRPPPERPAAPTPTRGPSLAVEFPPGLGGETAANLRLALGAIESGYTPGVMDLPRLAAGAGERQRPLVRQVVVEVLSRLAREDATRGYALDAALALTADGDGDLAPIVEGAIAGVEEGETTAAEALVFLAHVSAEVGAPAVPAVTALMQEELRQLHLRVLAAQVLARWQVASEARNALAGMPRTPAVLRRALGSE